MKTVVTAVALIGLLIVAVAGTVYVWIGFGDIEMSTAGILAMIAGVVLTLAVGIGLMYLVFHSEGYGPDEH